MTDSWLIAVASAHPWVSAAGDIIWPDGSPLLDRPKEGR